MESRIKEYKKITINDYSNYEPENAPMAELMVSGLNISIRVEIYGK